MERAKALRRQDYKKPSQDHRSYWLGNVFVDQGLAWAIEERETGDHQYELRDLCLGKEAEVVPVLKGQKAIPDNMHPLPRAILQKMLEGSQSGREVTTGNARGPSYLRTKAMRNIRYRAKGIGRVASRKRLSHH